MKKKYLLLSITLTMLLVTSVALAAPSGFNLSWWTVDGGGGTIQGGGYNLSGTIGQPDTRVLLGGGYTLAGGFWSEVAVIQPARLLYLPLVNR